MRSLNVTADYHLSLKCWLIEVQTTDVLLLLGGGVDEEATCLSLHKNWNSNKCIHTLTLVLQIPIS